MCPIRKFKKILQAILLKNICDAEKVGLWYHVLRAFQCLSHLADMSQVPKSHFKVLLEYVDSVKGQAREVWNCHCARTV